MSKKLIAGAGVVASFAVALAPLATFAEGDPVSASDQHTDELVVTVLPSCTFGSAKKSGTSYPSGITHNAPTDTGYAADGSTTVAQTRGATAWNTTQTAEAASGTDEGGHNADDVDSTGYGILVNEGGLTTDNSSALSNSSEHTVHRSMYAGVSTTTFAKTTMYIVCNNGDGYSITATAEDLSNGTTTEDIPVTNATISESTAASTSGYNGVVTTADASDAPTNLTNITSKTETIIAKKSGVTKEDGDSITVTYGMSIKTSQKADTYDGKVVYKLYKGLNGANTGA